MNATTRTESVLDHMLVKHVRTRRGLGGKQLQLISCHEPKQRASARAHGAVTSHAAIDLAFNLEGDPAAVTTTFVFHYSPSAEVSQ
jgi:hypothetical protein